MGRPRRRGNTHPHTQTCTLTWSHSAGRLSQKSSQRIEFSQKSFQSKGRWRRAELIIPDISGSEQVSYNNNYSRLLSICSVGQVRCLGRASGGGKEKKKNTRDEVSVEVLKRVTRPAAAAIFETLQKSQRPFIPPADVKHFSISFPCRMVEDSVSSQIIRVRYLPDAL